ncbi:MAG: hypothetical protein OXI74_01335 [Rhodospirillaceae bacterium]|nr:hypothetical protein [Rhodospirillaceae bacterium]
MFDLRSIVETVVCGGVRPGFRFRSCTGLVLACLLGCGLGVEARAQDGGGEVTIPDEGLRCAIIEALGKAPDEAVTRDELAALAELSSSCDPTVVDLAGLEHATGLELLELPGNAVSDLAPLSDLTALGVLVLADNAIVDLAPLSGLDALQSLDLSGNRIADIGPLAALTDLRWLVLKDNAISDIGPLSDLTALGTLDLSDNRVADLAPLAELTELTWLRLNNNVISDLAPVSDLTALGTLNLSNNRILDLAPLAPLTELTLLDLDYNAILDIGPLSGLTALGSLNLENNRITDIRPLAALTGLNWLSLSANAVPDVGPLADLTGLEALYLDENAITEIEPLSALTDLSWLSLADNAITDIGPLASLTGLTQLFLPHNAIEDIGPLASLAALRGLNLGHNSIADIEPLAGLDALEALTLSDNSFLQIAPLADLTALARLDLRNNSIVDVEPLAGLATLDVLYLGGNSIRDVEPLSDLTGLTWLLLEDNAIENVEPLSGLTGLTGLDLGENAITDIGVLEGLAGLAWLILYDNAIEDIEPLSGLQQLKTLDIGANAIGDLEPLSGLTALQTLRVSLNSIENLEPLEGLSGLTWLNVYGNAIDDLEPLSGLTGLQRVFTGNNPLNAASVSGHLQDLREAGTTVHWDWEHDGREVVWFVPSARDPARQGFVRLINDSDEAGDVSIVAIDDLGRRRDPITLAIGANEAVHFNSNDLESGNPGKGLSGGTGPGDGDWRLEIDSDLAFTALSYMRTADGFLTALHDVVPVAGNGYRIVTFNPGSNLNQASSLRLSNPGTEDAAVTVTGVDDAGASPGSAVRVDVPAGASVTLAASDLESGAGLGGALGDGTGKWRLGLEPTQPIVAMSLLSSPTGHLTNLSTAMESSGGRYRVPLFPSASDAQGRQGFVRVRNRSDRAGLVRIEAYDDSEAFHKAIVYLRIGAGETRHVNSRDLESGNASKGLVGSTGPTRGDWALAVSSRLDIDVQSYIRTADGFLTSMHDVAPRGRGAAHVAIFNPGSNRNQASRLRLYNPGSAAAAVRITATDDAGAPGSAVTLTVPGRAARTISAAELESGGAGLNGALGDGRGKWRLRVESDEDIGAMHLLSSPTGHLTNLSTAPD